MKIGDIVNVKKDPSGYWKGEIVDIERVYKSMPYSHYELEAYVEQIDGDKHAVINENKIKYICEYYQK